MKSNLGNLLKAELTKQFCINTFLYEKDTKKRARTIAMAVICFILILILGGYCFLVSYGFGSIGMSYLVPGYALTITSIITLFFTFIKTNGILFGTKDYDMLMALPIRSSTIITSKFLSMYINSLAFTLIVMIPMAIGYGMYQPFHIISFLSWCLGSLIAPLLPMTVAAILGTIIIGIGSRFKHKVFAQMILTVTLFIGVFAISFIIQEAAVQDEALLLSTFAELGTTISNALHQIYPLSKWFDMAVNNQDLFSFVLFMGVSIGIYGVFVFLTGKFYSKINSSLKAHRTASNYKVETLKSSSMMASLIYKEWKRFTSSTVYMMNIGIGLIIALLVSGVSAFVGVDQVMKSMNLKDISTIKPFFVTIMPFAIAMIVNMCNTSSVSLSLEGRNLWIVDSLPIGRKTLLQSKMLFNIILVLPVSIVCNIIFMFVLPVNGWMGLLYVLFSVTSVLFSTMLGSFINLRFPNFTWDNEVQVIKQSLSSMIGIFSSMLVYLFMIGGAVLLSKMISGELIVLCFSALTALFAFIIYKKIVSFQVS